MCTLMIVRCNPQTEIVILTQFNIICTVGECSNKECQYLHIDPQSKIKDCPWYDRGFCKHGKNKLEASID
jgi:hypothetical protein